MLQQIGDSLKGHKWLTYVVFGALALIFAAWGAYGISNLSFGTSSYVAKVNGHTIAYEDVRRDWQREQNQWQQRFGGEIPAGERSLLEDQLLESVVRQTLLTDRATDLGYRVTQADLAATLRAEPAFQLDGHYNAEVAKSRLAQAGITEEQYANDLKNDLQRRQVEDGLQLSEFITPTELERLHALEDQERQIRYAALPLDKYSAAVQLTDGAIQAYYDAHKAQFMTPESVHLQYAQLSLSQVAAQVTVSDADLKDYYAKNKNRYISTEQRHSHHILVAVNDKVDAAAALKKAQDIEAKLKAGGNFEALAKQYSDDAGSAAQGGDLGLAERGSLEAPFGDALFAMKPGEVSAPVRSKFGYHIIRLDDIVAAHGKTFEEARADVMTQLRHDRAADKFGDVQEQIQQRIDQAGESLDTLAKEFGLTQGDIPEFLKGTGGGDLGSSKELQSLVFSDTVLNLHRLGGPILIGDDRLVLIKDLSHAMPAPKPLAAVHDVIVALMRKELGGKAARAAADAAAKSLEAGKDFDAVAKELGVTAEAARFVGRQDPSVPSFVRDAAFKAPKPAEHKVSYQALSQPDGGAVVLGVLAVRVDAQPADKQETAAQVKDLAAQYAEADATAYVEQVRKGAKVQKNIAMFDQQ
ncbi:MAG TPA: SurA N-terminal domain-containing protein [Steroidobacteraceae bacterium]|nr:SurA N-terminal domain-containing protein [Steroidobacteraceae bacterium]